MAQARAQVAAAKARLKQYREQVAKLKKKVDTVPQVEAQLTRLKRDYQTIRETYQDLLQRKQRADISQDAKRNSNQIQFRVVDPVRVPNEPVAPDRRLLVTASFGGALLGGAALGVFFSLLWPTFYSRSELYSVTGVPVLGAVHQVVTPRGRARRFLKISAYLVALGGLIVAFGAALTLIDEREAILASVNDLVTFLTAWVSEGGSSL